MKHIYQNLFTPIMLNQMILKNRIFASSGVHAGDIHHGELVSKHSVSMVCTCMNDIAIEKSYFYPNKSYSFSKNHLDTIRTNVRRIHQGGAKYVLELDHVGEYYRPETGDFAWGCIDKINEKNIVVKALDKTEMKKIARGYAITAQDAINMGFDALIFDCSAGWLMSQFLSPHYNKRTDEFGGSIENRAKFPLNVIREIRKTVGVHVPIFCQICVNEYFEDGITFEDVKHFLTMIEPYIDCVFAICGNDQNHKQMTKLVTTNLEPHMINASYTEELKKHISVPVALLGAVMTPEEAESVIASKKADLVGLSRPLIADPSFVEKIMLDKTDEIVPCIRCNQCFHVSTDYKYIGCSVNPHYTQQKSQYVERAKEASCRKRIVVVGGGPAGIQAALSAFQCGHDVILLEKEKELGGLLRLIACEFGKEDIKRYLEYLIRQIQQTKIKVYVNTRGTKDLICSLNPDKVIIAIGAKQRSIDLKHSNVMSALQAIAFPDKVGKDILIIGGGTVGCELALGFAVENKTVTLVESSTSLAGSANELYSLSLMEHMNKCHTLKVWTKTKCISANDQEIILKHNENNMIIHADTVIYAVGMISRTLEAYDLFGCCLDTDMVGDVNHPGNIIDAVYEGYTCGLNVS